MPSANQANSLPLMHDLLWTPSLHSSQFSCESKLRHLAFGFQVSSPLVPHGMHLHAMCRHLICQFASKYMNSDRLRIQRNSTVYLDFTRPIRRLDPRRHPRYREFPGLQPVSIDLLYPGSHILLPLKEFRPEIHTHIYTITCICNSH